MLNIQLERGEQSLGVQESFGLAGRPAGSCLFHRQAAGEGPDQMDVAPHFSRRAEQQQEVLCVCTGIAVGGKRSFRGCRQAQNLRSCQQLAERQGPLARQQSAYPEHPITVGYRGSAADSAKHLQRTRKGSACRASISEQHGASDALPRVANLTPSRGPEVQKVAVQRRTPCFSQLRQQYTAASSAARRRTPGACAAQREQLDAAACRGESMTHSRDARQRPAGAERPLQQHALARPVQLAEAPPGACDADMGRRAGTRVNATRRRRLLGPGKAVPRSSTC